MFFANKGPIYTPHGENETLIQMKALAFRDTYKQFLEHKDITKLIIPKDVDDIAWSEVCSLYNHKDRVRWMKLLIQKYNLDLRFCTEDDIRDVLVRYIFMNDSSKDITSKKTVSDICTNIRMMFRNIGREYSWEHNKKFTLFKSDLILSGNPMTTGTERLLKDKLCKEKKDVLKKGEKLAGAVSIPMAYIFIVWLLSRLMNDIRRWEAGKITQKERIINLAYLTLLWAFSMHEGPRYSEIVEYLRYDKLYIPLHKKVYWLSLVFMKKETLKHLFLGNNISYYVMSLYKSKKMKVDRPRMKAVIPAPYNSIDLLTIFVFCMRCIMTLDFDGQLYSTLQVFKKKNYSDLRKERVKSIGLKNMSFYSCRYGAAVDDIKACTQVKENWTRYRMGHTPTSQMKDKYGSNKDRVMLDDEIAEMGMDVFEVPTYENNKGISLEFLPMDTHGCSYNEKWIENTFKTNENDGNNLMRDNFENISNVTKAFIECNDQVTQEKYKNILASAFEYRHGNFSWIDEFPMGFYINFPKELVTPKMKVIFDDAIDVLCSSKDGERIIFEVDPPKLIPELWSFPQVVYGNWRQLITCDITSLEKPPVLKITNERQVKSRKRPRLDDNNVYTIDGDYSDYMNKKTHKEYVHVKNIKINNVIGILTDRKDSYTYSVDNSFIWFMKVEQIRVVEHNNDHDLVESIAYARGRFYKYIDDKFVIDIRKYRNEVVIPQSSLVEIYNSIENNDLIIDDTRKSILCQNIKK